MEISGDKGRRPPPRWVVITCEHASPSLPPGEDLRVSPEVLESPAGWDRGSLLFARRLAGDLAAPLHQGRLSRLWVDLDRREQAPDIIPETAAGVEIPGNRRLSRAERQKRILRWHRPWRSAVRASVERALDGGSCLHLSVHSFAPAGDRRDLDVAILFDPDRATESALARRLRDALTAAGLRARLSAPHKGTGEGTTAWLREAYGDPHYVGLDLQVSEDLPDVRVDEASGVLAREIRAEAPVDAATGAPPPAPPAGPG